MNKELVNFLMDDKGYTEEEIEETDFRREYNLEIPKQVKEDIEEFYKIKSRRL